MGKSLPREEGERIGEFGGCLFSVEMTPFYKVKDGIPGEGGSLMSERETAGREEILNLLRERGVWFELTEHRAVYHMGELCEAEFPYPEGSAKNLFVRDDKRRNFYLITVKGEKRVDLKAFRRVKGTRPLSFCSESELMSLLGLTAGSVSPFGVLNDQGRRVEVFLDREFFDDPGMIGVHPNDNTATVWMRTEDLAAVIEGHGNKVEMVSV